MVLRRVGFYLSIALFIIFSLILGGCRVVPTGNPGANPAEIATPTPTLVSPGGVVAGQASVERVEIMMRESFPVQISALAIGSLPDSCTSLDQVLQEREDTTFHISLTTVRPADQICAAALVPFQKAVEIESVGLKAGKYTVIVNGVSAEFELQVDNVLVEDPIPGVSPKPAAADSSTGYPVPPSPPVESGYPNP